MRRSKPSMRKKRRGKIKMERYKLADFGKNKREHGLGYALKEDAKEFGRRAKNVIAGMGLVGVLLFGGGCEDKKEIVVDYAKREYQKVEVIAPELCKKDLELRLVGRYKLPIVHCKDVKGEQLVCDNWKHCYVLKKKK